MAAKTKRLETRLTATERKQIERAANLAGEPVSAFVIVAALARAETVVTEHASTLVPSDYFDKLVASLDEASEAPRLARAVRRARRRRRIKVA